jgi:regulator of protease activity HflC (stomatin/prohibitin superfamily)
VAKREQQTKTETGPIPVDPTKTVRKQDGAGPPAIPIGQMSVLEDLVRQLEESVRSARNMPLSSSALVDRKEVLDLIELLKRSIPEEIARARAVIRDRDDVVDRARTQAERVLERAQTEREQQLSKTEIVQAASREADRMVAEAEAVSRRIKAEAESYVEGKLATFEVVLQKTLAAVERGRARLGGRLEQDELSSEELDEAHAGPIER